MAISQTILEQYAALKHDVPECLLLMQVGIFMQVLNEDARTVSQVSAFFW